MGFWPTHWDEKLDRVRACRIQGAWTAKVGLHWIDRGRDGALGLLFLMRFQQLPRRTQFSSMNSCVFGADSSEDRVGFALRKRSRQIATQSMDPIVSCDLAP